jgi:hypothetical protein
MTGFVRPRSWRRSSVVGLGNKQPVPIFQQLARGHPSGLRYPLSLRNVEDLLGSARAQHRRISEVGDAANAASLAQKLGEYDDRGPIGDIEA